MDSKSNIVSELLNIMNLRDLPRSLYSVFGRQVLSLPPARDLSMFIELSLSPSGQITATWNCTFKPLRYCSWGNTAGQSLSTMFSTKDSWAGHWLATSQVKLKLFFKWAATGNISFHACLIILQWWSAWQQLLPLRCFGTGHRVGLSSLLCVFTCWFTDNQIYSKAGLWKLFALLRHKMLKAKSN